MSNGTYKIQKGDTLSKIAKANNTTVAALAQLNGIGNVNKIYAGDMLTLTGDAGNTGGQGGSYPTMLGGGGTYTLPGGVDLGGGGWTAPGLGGGMSPGGQAGYPGTAAYTPTNLTHAGTGKQLVDMTGHAPGYSGLGYFDDREKAYTDYGAYLRTDNFAYPTGAKISPNGMYYDVGNGWQYAGQAVQRNRGTGELESVASEVYGLAPGTRLYYFDGNSSGGGSGNAAGDSGSGGAGGAGGAGSGTTPTAEELQAMLNLLEYSYRYHLQDEWEDYVQGNRTDY